VKKYQVTLQGTQPLLMHRDNFEFDDAVKEWQTEPANKNLSVPGDDRSPAWTWMGRLYHEDGLVGISSDNLMTMIREGAAMVKVGKGNLTFKSQSQSGVITESLLWPVVINGKEIPLASVEGLVSEDDFSVHQSTVSEAGFELFVKRAKVGTSKHIRVRPLFRGWSASGVLLVVDDKITAKVLGMILDQAGQYKGLGDWRPSSPKSPGRFGTFAATVEPVA